MPDPSISVAIPAHRRVEKLVQTLRAVHRCSPPPDEVLVHLDEDVKETRLAVATSFPNVRLLASSSRKGPGGARNILIREAQHDWIATFDDDSFPDHPDFFARVQEDILRWPDTAVFSSGLLPASERTTPPYPVAVFSGCGSVYNRSWFLRTRGYVSRPVAYGLEEVDLSLQIHALGGQILRDPGLNVLHDHPITAPFPVEMVRDTIVNQFLFPWLRYPALLLPLGLSQALAYWARSAAAGNGSASFLALRDLPRSLLDYLPSRAPVSARAVLSWLRLRHKSGM